MYPVKLELFKLDPEISNGGMNELYSRRKAYLFDDVRGSSRSSSVFEREWCLKVQLTRPSFSRDLSGDPNFML